MDRRKEQIREFLGRFVRTQDLGNADDLFDLGVVNSLFAMELVNFVESEFGIVVTNEDLEVRNFCSVDAISGFVGAKLPAGSAGRATGCPEPRLGDVA
jgi:acyl carrier protein